jgi:hypothetical protein
VRADADGATGLLVSDLTVGLALIKPTTTATQLAQYKSFFALKAAATSRWSGSTASRRRSPTCRSRSTTPPASARRAARGGELLANTLSIPTGIGTDPVVITAKGRLIRARGTVTLGFGGFIYVSGTIGFSKGRQLTNMTLVGGGSAGTLDLITVEATGVNVFAGVDGPASASGAKGISIQNVNLGLAILKPIAPVGNRKSYLALSISAASASLIGIDGVTAALTEIEVEMNSAGDPAVAAGTAVPRAQPSRSAR